MKLKGFLLIALILIFALVPAFGQAAQYLLSVHTDKPVYQAGETVVISGQLTQDGKPAPFYAVSVTVENQGGILFVDQATTDKDGSFQSLCTLPSSAPSGSYRVTVGAAGVQGQVDFYVGTISDSLPPTSQILQPQNNEVLTSAPVLISGTATDNQGLRLVEVSLDGGTTWLPASGTLNWAYLWENPANGSYRIQSRATDLAGNVEDPASGVQVTVNIASTPTPTPTSTPTPTPTPTASPTPTVTPTPTSTPSPTPTPTLSFFPDLSNHWARDFVENLALRGLINGYPDGLFHPDNPITRAEFTKILVLALNLELINPPQPQFSDVPQDFWGFTYIETAQAKGIVKGIGQGEFAPQRNITRAEIVTMIGRALNLESVENLPFSDKNEIPDFASGFVGAVTAKGIVNGFPDGTFRPANLATRAEAATMIWRMLSLP